MTSDATQSVRVVDADDAELRRFTHEHLKVMAKFTSDDCEYCKLLAPPFVQFATDPEFAGIAFLRLNVAENPVAKQLMAERAAPFFVSYCQGRMLECDTQTTEAGVLAQLRRLRAFEPVH